MNTGLLIGIREEGKILLQKRTPLAQRNPKEKNGGSTATGPTRTVEVQFRARRMHGSI
jgi:hypothetical protein